MAIIQTRKFSALLAGLILPFFLTGCASTGDVKNGVSTSSNESKMSLPAQTLQTGECGLFVWAASPAKPFILFSEQAKARALWFNESQEPLTLIESAGGNSYGQSSINAYQRTNGQTLALSLTDAEAIEGGMRYKSGTLSYMTSDGWGKVVPVIGLAACQT